MSSHLVLLLLRRQMMQRAINSKRVNLASFLLVACALTQKLWVNAERIDEDPSRAPGGCEPALSDSHRWARLKGVEEEGAHIKKKRQKLGRVLIRSERRGEKIKRKEKPRGERRESHTQKIRACSESRPVLEQHLHFNVGLNQRS